LREGLAEVTARSASRGQDGATCHQRPGLSRACPGSNLIRSTTQLITVNQLTLDKTRTRVTRTTSVARWSTPCRSPERLLMGELPGAGIWRRASLGSCVWIANA
jgi:hypothetical protein